ncbi:MAG: cation-efflux pump, partial [Lachnospiraceae bacterium]|nr:cation-efflux pump [Lachnospiraceae bacterium]
EDEITNRIRHKVEDIIVGMEGEVKFHDFRIVHGPTHTNLIFDVVVPYDYRMSDEEVVSYIKEQVEQLGENYFAVIDVDKAYV